MAALNHARAQNNLGGWLLNGRYITRNERDGLILMTLAAEQGIPESMMTLGQIYQHGLIH